MLQDTLNVTKSNSVVSLKELLTLPEKITCRLYPFCNFWGRGYHTLFSTL